MGLLHQAPRASDTVWLPWKPPGGEKQPDASDHTEAPYSSPGGDRREFPGTCALESFSGHRGLSLHWLASYWPLLSLQRTQLTGLGRARPPEEARRGKHGTISRPLLTALRLSSGPESAELCLLSFYSWSSAPSQVSGVSPSFSAFPFSAAVTVVPLALYHSISLSLPAGDSAKCLILFLGSMDSSSGWGREILLRREGGPSRGRSAKVMGERGS